LAGICVRHTTFLLDLHIIVYMYFKEAKQVKIRHVN